MDQLRGYILSIVAAAAIVGIVCTFVSEKSTAGGVMRMAGGLYLCFVILQPVASFDFSAVTAFAQQEFLTGEQEAAAGEQNSREAVRRLIKQETEAYIMDKASQFQADITVDVTLSEAEVPVPVCATITGTISEAAKSCLEEILDTDLNISKENQIWIG